MVTKENAIKQIMAKIGNGKITLVDAIKQAQEIKPLKGKNPEASWKGHFKMHTVISKEGEIEYVSAKVVTPAPKTPEVAPAQVALTTTIPVEVPKTQ